MSNMAEIMHHHHGSKLVMVVSMLLMVLTTQQILVKAVDIQGFDNAGACSGSGYTFPGIGAQVCTAMNVGSILIRNLASCQTGRAYRNGGCTTAVLSGNGPTVWCFTGGSFTGAAWFNNCRRRRRLQGAADQCTESAAPNGVHYTEDLAKGSWVLNTGLNAAHVLVELQSVDDGEKVNWLKAHGAYHVAGSDQVTTVV